MTRLLVLDDDERQQADIVGAARDAGFSEDDLTVVGTLEDARKWLHDPFEIAVADIHLGNEFEEAGLTFIQELKEVQPECRVIAITTKYDNVIGVRAMAFGAADFISGKWQRIEWTQLLAEKLTIFKCLAEGEGFPLRIQD